MENEKDKMTRLSRSFEQKGEIFKEQRQDTNSEKLKEELKRLSSLASGANTSSVREAFGVDQTGGFHGTNQPKGIASIADNMYGSNNFQGGQGISTALKDGEALELSIKRTLNSGAPVNDIAFYDEINWNLARLGFPSKLPQDIKNTILKMIN